MHDNADDKIKKKKREAKAHSLRMDKWLRRAASGVSSIKKCSCLTAKRVNGATEGTRGR